MLKNKNDLSAEVAWTLSKNVSNECVLCCVLNMYLKHYLELHLAAKLETLYWLPFCSSPPGGHWKL
jgi:hypothetical protein